MYKAIDIANWFIFYNEFKRNMMNEDTDYMSNLRLQKLVFYAQSAAMALKGKPLFEEKIEAWTHGPVIPEVYAELKKYKSSGISEYNEESIQKISKEDSKILEQVYEIFGEYSAWGLRNLTHSEEPWMSTPQGEVISLDKMAKTFKANYIED